MMRSGPAMLRLGVSNPEGLLACARYALSPNLLHYCGPEKQQNLRSYIINQITDVGLSEILHRFDVLYPYLKLIAEANSIKDPFDPRVVEAYWIGNSLLHTVKKSDTYKHILTGYRKRFSNQRKSWLAHLDGFLPHHAHHVMILLYMTGRGMELSPDVTDTIGSCSILWGRLVAGPIRNPLKSTYTYTVRMRPLKFVRGAISFGEYQLRSYQSVINSYSPGDSVTLHWHYICGKLSKLKLHQLRKYTYSALDLARSVNIFV